MTDPEHWRCCGAVLWVGCQHEQRRVVCEHRPGHVEPHHWTFESLPEPPCRLTWTLKASR